MSNENNLTRLCSVLQVIMGSTLKNEGLAPAFVGMRTHLSCMKGAILISILSYRGSEKFIQRNKYGINKTAKCSLD